MRILKVLVPFLLTIMMMAGCGGSKSALDATGDIPDWFTTPPVDPNFLFASKSGVSQDMQMAVEKATTEARADISRQMEIRVQGLVKNFGEEVGTSSDSQLLSQFTSASKQVTSNVLSGTRVKTQKVLKEGTGYRAYVLMQLPVGAAADQFLQSMKKDDKTYTRFRATETFKELDDEAKKFDDFKKNQGQ
jgi:hypothetical protein